MRHLSLILLFAAGGRLSAVSAGNTDTTWLTPFEKSAGKESATYAQCMDYFSRLAGAYPQLSVYHREPGMRQAVYRLTAAYKDSRPRVRILVNNAIHAGEPDGIDASMMLVRDLLQKKEWARLLEETELYIIPVYNIDGALKRGCCSRANQEGPLEYGVRANGQNYDLNRDFMKADAPETGFFQRAFHTVRPHIFIDTHVSNGADYQYVMTYIATQHNKLHPLLADYMHAELIPALNKNMKKAGYELCPYVNVFGHAPDSGYAEFMESPRFATGYTTLFNCMGFVTETHMLKPYKDRVYATYNFLLETARFASAKSSEIIRVKKQADSLCLQKQDYNLGWRHRSDTFALLHFKGYQACYKPSEVSGKDRLYYDRGKPFTKPVKYYNTYEPDIWVKKPQAYLIPTPYLYMLKPYLENNHIRYSLSARDTFINVKAYRILNYYTPGFPYEGHYVHSRVEVDTSTGPVRFSSGYIMISTDQPGCRYIIELLEPQSPDGLFAWNRFDAILQQKEHFSDYVWEDKAAELLKTDAVLKEKFEKKKKEDPAFSGDAGAQLEFIYRHSPYFEPGFMRYPVFRVE